MIENQIVEISKRLIELREILGYGGRNMVKFAEEIDYPYTNYSKVEKGERDLNMTIIQNVSNRFKNVNINWLINGEGSPLINNNIILNTLPLTNIPFFDIPISAGSSIATQLLQIPDKYLELPNVKMSDIAFPVRGSSMSGYLEDGDIVVCRRLGGITEVKNGFMYLFILSDGSCTIKFSERIESDRIRLYGSNPSFRYLEIPLNEIIDVWKVIIKITEYFGNPDI